MVPGANPEKLTTSLVDECATTAASNAQASTKMTNNAVRRTTKAMKPAQFLTGAMIMASGHALSESSR